MGGGRVGAAPDDGGLAVSKVAQAFLESVQLRAANGGEVLGVEEQHDILIAKRMEREVAHHLAVDDGGGGEFRGGFAEHGHLEGGIAQRSRGVEQLFVGESTPASGAQVSSLL